MNKHQIAITAGAILLLSLLFFFGSTVAPTKVKSAPAAGQSQQPLPAFNIEQFLQQTIANLSAERQQYVSSLLAEIKRGDVKTQSHTAFHKLSIFYTDSVSVPVLQYYYLGKVSELDNTEKSLTFAAHSVLRYLPYEEIPAQKQYLAVLGKSLFDKALLKNANNDSTIVGLGGCIMYGGGEGANPMDGILKVRDVAARDSNNIFAQYMLGIGGVISGQYDKAVKRFETVANAQPKNIEVLFKIAESYERLGDDKKAADWYEKISGKVNIPTLKAELDKRIQALRAK